MRAFDIFDGSDAKQTTDFYCRLMQRGPAGFLAAGLFRAQKRSVRAKEYRRRKQKAKSYDSKNEALQYVDAVLARHAEDLGIEWGWKLDPMQPKHRNVLYVDLPDTIGQVSFHSESSFSRKTYPRQWDGAKEVCWKRVCTFCDAVMKMPVAQVRLMPDDLIPFGKHVGMPMKDVPHEYLDWLREWDGLQQWWILQPEEPNAE